MPTIDAKDIESCGVNYQRYFKNDVKMQNHLDSMFVEMKRAKN